MMAAVPICDRPAIEASANLGWWDSVNYYRAVAELGGKRHGRHP